MKYIKYVFLVICFCTVCFNQINAQVNKTALYNDKADAQTDLNNAIKQAENENKNILIQVGGNWCKWCIAFHKFINNDKQIDSLIKADYVFLLINYSKENKNLEMLKKLEYPQRFGFPVLVVLDKTGKRIHTQDSGYLELNKGYSHDKIMTFLKNWSPKALSPDKYK